MGEANRVVAEPWGPVRVLLVPHLAGQVHVQKVAGVSTLRNHRTQLGHPFSVRSCGMCHPPKKRLSWGPLDPGMTSGPLGMQGWGWGGLRGGCKCPASVHPPAQTESSKPVPGPPLLGGQRLTLRLSTDLEDLRDRVRCRGLQGRPVPSPKAQPLTGDPRPLAPRPRKRKRAVN